jgi:hypothetical protein
VNGGLVLFFFHTDEPAPTFIVVLLSSQVIGALQTSIATNLQHGPQSCAGRDERQFFTGDTALGAEASILSFGLGPMYTLWLDTALDEQNADGSVGFYAPTPITDGRDGSANWMTGFPTGTVGNLTRRYVDSCVSGHRIRAHSVARTLHSCLGSADTLR